MPLSIIIVNFNTKDLTIRCVCSIIQSKPKVKYEIIIIDNASTDDSWGALKKLSKKYKNIRIFGNKTNLGFAKANNLGISKARGKYILLLNSDTLVKEKAIDALYQFASKKVDAGVVGGQLINPDGSIQASVFRFPTIFRAFRQYWLGEKGVLDKFFPKTQEPCEVEAVVGAVFLITPSALKEVGKLDERYFMYFEDLDYCRRVAKAGLKVYYLPSAKIIHYHGASGKNIVSSTNQWRRLIPSSKIYHGVIRHYLINFFIWSGQKLCKLFRVEKS